MLIFIDAIGAGLVLPILPDLFFNKEYGIVGSYNEHLANLLYGLTFAIVPLVSLFSLPIFGYFSDIYGRKPLIMCGLIVLFFSSVLSIVAIMFNSLFLFLISRIVVGFSIGTYTIAYSMIADFTENIEDKVSTYKWPSLAFLLGFIIGPLLGGSAALFNGKYAFIFPFAIQMTLTILNVFVVLLLLVETHHTNNQTDSNFKLIRIFQEGFILVKKNKIIMLIISYGLLQFCMGLYFQSIGLYLTEYFNYSSGELGIFYLTMGLGVLFNTLWLQQKFQKNFKVNKIINLSLTTISLLYFLQLVSNHSIYIIWIGSILIYMFFTLSMNCYTGLINNNCENNQRGRLMSFVGQINSVTLFVSGILVGYVVATNNLLIAISLLSVISALIIMLKIGDNY